MHIKRATEWQGKGKCNMKYQRKVLICSLTGILLGFLLVMTGIGSRVNAGVLDSKMTVERGSTPKQVSIKKLTSNLYGFTIQWKKAREPVTGYQIAYSTGKNPEGKTAVCKNVGKSMTKHSFTKLEGNKTYHVWVRSYRVVKEKKYYSEWSKQKTVKTKGYLVAIDAGHQSRGNSAKDPNGPGSTTMKAKVTGGTQGRYTRQTEYELNLAVAKKLKVILEQRGYSVLMIRETNDVNISNAERAQIANKKNADVFIRIHANGSNSSSKNGAMTICQTSSNPYCKGNYKESRKLSDCVLNSVVTSTECRKERVWETDTMTGINWCKMPVTIIEMGYLSNEKEDRLLATDDYRNKMAVGMANGIDAYFK